MANNNAKLKKGITVPKPKTVSMRKYSELKAKYDKLIAENKEQAEVILKQREQIHSLQPELKDGRSMHAACGLGPIVNQEFIILDKVVSLVHNLNPFQRRTVVAGLLSSIEERMAYELAHKNAQCNNRSLELQVATEEFNTQFAGMDKMKEVITKFSK